MRLWTLLLLIIVLVAGIFKSTDLFESVSFNPLGHFMEPKTVSDNDTREREIAMIENDNEPVWGKMNYGSLSALKTSVTDVNGNTGVAIGESVAMMDMAANAELVSKVAPAPKGLTVRVLPGVQPDGTKLNSFVFTTTGNNNIMAPRNYYLSSTSVLTKYTDKGVIAASAKSKDLLQANAIDKSYGSINILQVPFGDEFMISDTTGVVTKASESQKMATSINKTLTKLTKLHNDKATSSELSKLLFKGNSISTEFSNVNNLINTGRYAGAYKAGLALALGNTDGKREAAGVLIKTDISHQDNFGQFDFIYNSIKSGDGKGYYSPELVSWGKKNADSIIHLLITNHMLQSQFKGTSGGYATPISMGKWGETKLTFFSDLNAKGRQSKEPFYLYTSIDPKAQSVSSKKTTPRIPSKYIQPDLAYIFALYNSIMAQVWIGANGNNTNGSTSQVWQDTVSAMNKRIKDNKVEEGKKELARDANKVSSTLSEYSQNNLVSGLSTNRGTKAKDGTATVYPNKEIIGALRVLLSGGDEGNGKKISLLGKEYKVTPIGDTKYTKKGEVSYLYRAFDYSSSDTFERWSKMIEASLNTPLQPAIFTSNWDSNSASAYIMMPTMLGGKDFPESIGIIMKDLLKSKDDTLTYTSLSSANKYVMAFNFKPNAKSKTTNTTGIVEIMADAAMGNALDASRPIVLSGYIGGESFSIIDYFKVQDALKSMNASTGLQAKTVEGKYVKLGYFNLFDDFFSIPNEQALTGAGIGKVEYFTGFDKAGYKAKYTANKTKEPIKQISPDYETFFNTTTVDSD